MQNLLLIAVGSVILLYLFYRPLANLARDAGKATVAVGKRKTKEAFSGFSVSTEAEKKRGLSLLLVILAAGFLLRIIGAAAYRGYETDINCFLAWADMLYTNGIGRFYSLDAFTDYPPGYMYILYGIGFLRAVFGIAQSSTVSIVLTKLPAILCDLGTAYLIYRIACARFKETGAAFLAGIYLITPAVFLDSAVWGQVDSTFTFCLVLMCYLVTERKMIPSYFAFAVSILLKPQSLIFTPVLLFGVIDWVRDAYRKEEGPAFYRQFFTQLGCGLLAILLIAVLMLPFGFGDALSQYTDTLGSYPYASVNAYNFWTMLGKNWASQTDTLFGVSCQSWGTLAIIATVTFAAYIHFKSKDSHGKYYFSAALIVSCVFTFSVRMHERYIFPAIVFLLLCYAVRPKKKFYLAYLFMGLVSFCNMAYVMFFYDASDFDNMDAFPIYVAAGMCCLLIYLIYLAVTQYARYTSDEEAYLETCLEREKEMKGREKKEVIRPSAPLGRMGKTDGILLAVITLIYAAVAFSNLGNRSAPETTYSVVEEGAVVLDFGEQVQIAEIWDYLGYKNNPKYIVSYADNMTDGWVDVVFDSETTWDAGGVFCWNCTETEITARYLMIAAADSTTEDSLIELVFTDADGNMLLPVNVAEYRALFDEQEYFEGRKIYTNGTYFDEIYHARTAYEMIHHLYCYENTHPPLGKIFIAIGVLIFGMNPFGWRFMGTLFGVLMLPIFYVFAKRFFKETWIATVTTVLFAFDFMHYTQTRIATIDVFVTLFIILAYLFMYSYTRKSFYDTKLKDTFVPLGLCGITMGLSWACKWTGIYASVGLCILFFAAMAQRYREYRYAKKHAGGQTAGISHQHIVGSFRKNLFLTLGFCCIFFIVVPAVIYTLSYIPMNDGTDHGLIRRMIDNQISMYNYHSNLEATHPYSSAWYEWPIMRRPIFYYSGTTADGLKEGISAFGNPLVWWAGIPAFIMVLYYAWKRKDSSCTFLAVGYLSQYLPWALIGRVVFIYHYFPSVPFVVLMIGFCMQKLVEEKPKRRRIAYAYTGAAVILFIMFYPVLTGTPVSGSYVNTYLKWFSTWVLVL